MQAGVACSGLGFKAQAPGQGSQTRTQAEAGSTRRRLRTEVQGEEGQGGLTPAELCGRGRVKVTAAGLQLRGLGHRQIGKGS